MADATARLRLNTALYDREAAEQAALALAGFASIEVLPATEEPIIELSVRARGGYALSDIVGELGNHALVSTVQLRRGG